MILARLLYPKDFGLFGIVMLVLSILEAFSQTGFNEALIYKKEDIAPYLDTAWGLQFIRGALLAGVIVGSASYIAKFFQEPDVRPLLRMIGVVLIIDSLQNIGIVYFKKELEFHRLIIFRLIGNLMELLASVSAAFLLRNVWALVVGAIVHSLTNLMISYLIHDFRPHFRWDAEKAKELLKYGKWLFGKSSIGYLVNNLDDIIVGKVLGTATLGLYQMAFRWANTATTEIIYTVSEVTFPAYVKLQSDTTRLREYILRTIGIVSLITLPLTGGILVLAPELTKFLLGDRWMPIVPVLQLMCITGAVRAITANFGTIFLSTGRPDIQVKASISNLFLLGICIYPFVKKFDIIGAVYARFVTLLTQLYTWPRLLKILGLRFNKLVEIFIVPLAATLVMIFVLLGTKKILAGEKIFYLLILGVIGFITYLVCLGFFDLLLHSIHKKNILAIVNAMKIRRI